MRTARLVICFVFAAAAVLGHPANAQDRACRGLDDCERLHFEQAERQLSELVPRILAQIDRHTADETRAVAASEFAEAQRHWSLFRDSTCKGRAAELYHRSARMTEGLIANCLERMTKERLAALKQDYPALDQAK